MTNRTSPLLTLRIIRWFMVAFLVLYLLPFIFYITFWLFSLPGDHIIYDFDLVRRNDNGAVRERRLLHHHTLRKVQTYMRHHSIPWSINLNFHTIPNWLPSGIKNLLLSFYSCKQFEHEGQLVLPVYSASSQGGQNYQTDAVYPIKNVTDRMGMDSNSPTLVTQLSANRYMLLISLIEFWPAPISAAIYVSHSDQHIIENIFMNHVFYKRENVLLHFVPQMGEFYPVNQLRNIAIKAARTDYIFITDVDFMPSPNMHHDLSDVIKTGFFSAGRQALVIPAFELLKKNMEVPSTKQELKENFNLTVSQFHFGSYPRGHRETNYTRWFESNDIYKVKWQDGYEPYIMVKKSEIPYFNQQFLGRLLDKISFNMALDFIGFQFNVHPTAFVAHIFHEQTNVTMLYAKCSRKLIWDYKKTLNEIYIKREAKSIR